jgi:serine/threonine-protein kinase RsbW
MEASGQIEATSTAGAGTAKRGPPPVELSLPARPESVALARAEAARLGEALGYDDARIGDLRTVVSEACMNAALHAYETVAGDFQLRVDPGKDRVMITVTDHGQGIRPRPAFESPSARLGLLLIAALSSRLEISNRGGRGTLVRIDFGPKPPA